MNQQDHVRAVEAAFGKQSLQAALELTNFIEKLGSKYTAQDLTSAIRMIHTLRNTALPGNKPRQVLTQVNDLTLQLSQLRPDQLTSADVAQPNAAT